MTARAMFGSGLLFGLGLRSGLGLWPGPTSGLGLWLGFGLVGVVFVGRIVPLFLLSTCIEYVNMP